VDEGSIGGRSDAACSSRRDGCMRVLELLHTHLGFVFPKFLKFFL
jgi:hypothetical protein